MSHCMRKPIVCICENKDADQLCGNREADQRFCFHYTDSTIPLHPKYKMSHFYPLSVAAQPGLCQTWSETQIVGVVTRRLILYMFFHIYMFLAILHLASPHEVYHLIH